MEKESQEKIWKKLMNKKIQKISYENEKYVTKTKKNITRGNSYDHEKINENETLQNEKKM